VSRFFDLMLNGLTYGLIYSLVALGLVLIWRATHVINFAQGAMAMFTTLVAVSLIDRHVDYWAAFAVALAVGLVSGAVVERTLIRPLHGKPELNPVVVTVGLLILLEAAAGAIWGGNYRSFPAAYSQLGITLGHTRVAFSQFDLFILSTVVGLMLAMLFLFRATSLGLRMRASAFAPEVARLLGVRVGRILTVGWGLAALVGSLAGLLVAPKIFLYPNNMDTILVFGFAAAVMGGLDSPVGALVGGLLTGLAISFIGGYLGSSLEAVGALAILLLVLTLRPEGIFARPAARRV
jgi:branched-chain amino acid transport system permease protein